MNQNETEFANQDKEREINKRLRLIYDFLDNLAVAFPVAYLISIGTMGKRFLTVKIDHKGQSEYVPLFAEPDLSWEENRGKIIEILIHEFLKMEETWIRLSINEAYERMGL